MTHDIRLSKSVRIILDSSYSIGLIVLVVIPLAHQENKLFSRLDGYFLWIAVAEVRVCWLYRYKHGGGVQSCRPGVSSRYDRGDDVC